MTLADFIHQRRGDWTRLEQLIDHVENSGLGSLDDGQATAFAGLYRRTASDLNQARTFLGGDATSKYLNDLVARCYVAVHARTKLDWRGFLGRLFWGYPAHFRRHLPHFMLATAITAVAVVFGFLASLHDPLRARAMFLPDMPMIQPGQETNVHSTGSLAGFSSMLFTNNTRVCLLVCALGMTWGIGTGLVLWYNGLLLGTLAAVFCEAGEFTAYCTGVLPHGVLEIPAILISGAAGFVLAEALIRARPWPRVQELGRAGRQALWLVAGCFPLMGAAALLEAVVARAPDWYLSSGVKLAAAGTVGVLFLGYLLVLGWRER